MDSWIVYWVAAISVALNIYYLGIVAPMGRKQVREMRGRLVQLMIDYEKMLRQVMDDLAHVFEKMQKTLNDNGTNQKK